MERLRTKKVTQRIGGTLLTIFCSLMFLSTASAAENWSLYHKDATCSYYYDKGSITYPSEKKKLFGWTIDKDIIGLWVKVIEQGKEPPDENTEIFQQDENAIYVEVTCSKANVNLKDVVPSNAQKSSKTPRVIMTDEKIVKGIESGATKEALVDVICRPH